MNAIQSRRGLLTGAVTVALASGIAANAAAVCVAPGFDGPDAKLIDISKQAVRLTQEANEAWAAWEVHELPIRNAVIDYEKNLIVAKTPQSVRYEMLKAFINALTRQNPECDRCYNIASAISDKRDATAREALQHMPTTLAGVAACLSIVKVDNPGWWKADFAELGPDEQMIVRLCDHLGVE
jgi:hypothetical protein